MEVGELRWVFRPLGMYSAGVMRRRGSVASRCLGVSIRFAQPLASHRISAHDDLSRTRTPNADCPNSLSFAHSHSLPSPTIPSLVVYTSQTCCIDQLPSHPFRRIATRLG